MNARLPTSKVGSSGSRSSCIIAEGIHETKKTKRCQSSNLTTSRLSATNTKTFAMRYWQRTAPLYNGLARQIHCRGMGTCGTCAIDVSGPVTDTTAIERWRLSFPPHKKGSGLRLACQCRVLGDIEIKKRSGLWGQKIDESC